MVPWPLKTVFPNIVRGENKITWRLSFGILLSHLSIVPLYIFFYSQLIFLQLLFLFNLSSKCKRHSTSVSSQAVLSDDLKNLGCFMPPLIYINPTNDGIDLIVFHSINIIVMYTTKIWINTKFILHLLQISFSSWSSLSWHHSKTLLKVESPVLRFFLLMWLKDG